MASKEKTDLTFNSDDILYSTKGSSIFIRRADDLNLSDSIPAGNYSISSTVTGELFLSKADKFSLPPKLYGDTEQVANRILNTFNKRKISTGLLLSGEKGSGKSLAAKVVCTKAAAELGIPAILINAPWKGEAFFEFLQSIRQPCIVYFDEFEKVYTHEEQASLLTLFDGAFTSNKLFILTINSKWKLDQNIINRPGRMLYFREYKGLGKKFIEEYCNDVLVNKGYITSVLTVASTFAEFNFDMLQSLVAEMNMHDEPAFESLAWLNIKPEHDAASEWTVYLRHSTIDKHIATSSSSDDDDDDTREWKGQPLNMSDNSLNFYVPVHDGRTAKTEANIKNRKGYNHRYVKFSAADIVNYDSVKEAYEYLNSEGFAITLTRKKVVGFSAYSKELLAGGHHPGAM